MILAAITIPNERHFDNFFSITVDNFGPRIAVDSNISPSGEQEGKQILALLSRLKTVRLDLSLFDEPEFKSLFDSSVQLPRISAGRENPFAPLGVGSVSSPVDTGGEDSLE